MYYNKAHFKEVGLDPEKPPKNWAELLDAAKKLTKPNGDRWGLQVPSDGFPYWLFQAGPISLGKNVVGAEPNKVFFNTPESLEALDFFVSLSQKDKVHPTGVIPWATTPDAFLAGKASMIYHTTGSLTNILSKATNPADVGVAFIPGKAGFGVPTGGGNLYIFKAAPQEQKDAAWKLVQFLSSPELAAEWSRDTGYIASRKSSYDTEVMKKLVAEKPQYGVARDQLQYAQKELTSHQGAQIQQIYGNAIQAAVEGKKDSKTALVDAQTAADKVLSQFK
jgi:sn-glycerol 3-phosphate transport system substrate-binding protein